MAASPPNWLKAKLLHECRIFQSLLILSSPFSYLPQAPRGLKKSGQLTLLRERPWVFNALKCPTPPRYIYLLKEAAQNAFASFN